MADVMILMGSKSDLATLEPARQILEHFEIPHEVRIISAHRTPERLYEFARNARKNGYKLIIAGAGGAAHLPGMTAAMTTLPVLGVPGWYQANNDNGFYHNTDYFRPKPPRKISG